MDTLKTEIKEKGVFVITLNRPKVLNSLNKEIIDKLLEAFDKAYEDQSIRTVVLTGEGRGFCSGADLAGGGWPSDPKCLLANQRQMLWKSVSTLWLERL